MKCEILQIDIFYTFLIEQYNDRYVGSRGIARLLNMPIDQFHHFMILHGATYAWNNCRNLYLFNNKSQAQHTLNKIERLLIMEKLV